MNSWFDPTRFPLLSSHWAPMDGILGFEKPGEEEN